MSIDTQQHKQFNPPINEIFALVSASTTVVADVLTTAMTWRTNHHQTGSCDLLA
jgi:hypothetical protein